MDRGMKKWKPFNSLISASYLLKKDTIVSMPNLSSDEVIEIENIIKLSLQSNSLVKFTYYKNNSIFECTSIVKKIDLINKNIYFTNGLVINFRQIYKMVLL